MYDHFLMGISVCLCCLSKVREVNYLPYYYLKWFSPLEARDFWYPMGFPLSDLGHSGETVVKREYLNKLP